MSVTITVQVEANGDDGAANLTAGTLTLANNTQWAGDVAGANYGCFQRFQLPLHPRTQVYSAALIVTCDSTHNSDPATTRIDAEDADNPAAPSDYADYAARVRTTANATWQTFGDWIADTEYSYDYIASIIQEVIDRPGWAYNNYINVFWEDLNSTNNDYRRGYGHTASAAKAAQLQITFDPPLHGGPMFL